MVLEGSFSEETAGTGAVSIAAVRWRVLTVVR